MDNTDNNITKNIEISISNLNDNYNDDNTNQEINMLSSDDIDTRPIISNNQELNMVSSDNIILNDIILNDINSMHTQYIIMVICIIIIGLIALYI